MKQVLRRPDVSGRLVKWAVELTQFDLIYQQRTAIKGQALADFIAEFTFPSEEDRDRELEPPKWTLYVDGASNEGGSGAGLMLVSPENHRICSTLRFSFVASNNEAEHEALQASLRLARELQVDSLQIFSDSKLVDEQVAGEFQARDERMAAYLSEVKEALQSFPRYVLTHIDCEANAHADVLAKLATSKDADLLGLMPIEILLKLASRS